MDEIQRQPVVNHLIHYRGYDGTVNLAFAQNFKRTPSLHAEMERKIDELTFAQVEEALLNGKILEHYPDTGRGESCLVVGFSGETPIHVVCGWRGEKIALITVYIPNLSIPGREET